MSSRRPHMPPPADLDVLARLRHARFSHGVICPRCGHAAAQRWGSFSGRQRYRCTSCRRTFSDLTGTPAAYSKKLGLWIQYSRCMAEGASVRRSARRVGICTSTSFRWRHAILRPLRETGGEPLTGWIEVGALTFAYSEKGARTLGDKPRHRGIRRGREWCGPRVGVAVACDRSDHVVTRIATQRRPSSADLESAFGARVAGVPTVIAAHGPFGPGSLFARRRGGRFIDARPQQLEGADPIVHVGTVRDYVFRLLDWMERFRGVATRYLANYLAWHCRVDRAWRDAVPRALLRWPTASGFG